MVLLFILDIAEEGRLNLANIGVESAVIHLFLLLYLLLFFDSELPLLLVVKLALIEPHGLCMGGTIVIAFTKGHSVGSRSLRERPILLRG